MPTRWDNIEILQTVDRLQEAADGAPAWANGSQLMEEVAGGPVIEESRHRGFIQEVHIAADEGYLTFRIANRGAPTPSPDSQPRYYLDHLTDFALTPTGQDRARGQRVVQPLPDPREDDGRLISALVLKQVAEAIAAEYEAEQTPVFLEEGGIPTQHLSVSADTVEAYIHTVLVNLDRWGSEGRRVLRGFIGRWLDDQLLSGPSNEQRAAIIEQLARQGWYVNQGNLVIGEPAAGNRRNSPVLRDARLAALHPTVAAAAERFLRDGHNATAVFEATKALTHRVKTMSGLEDDGTSLMGAVFSSDKPRLILGDVTTTSGRNVQDGFRFLFMGAVQGIRNPHAHDPATHMDENEALEHLGLLSLLMRKLDIAQTATQTQP